MAQDVGVTLHTEDELCAWLAGFGIPMTPRPTPAQPPRPARVFDARHATCPDCGARRALAWLKTYTVWKRIAWCASCSEIKTYWQQAGEEDSE